MLMIVLDVTVVNVALPYIQTDLGFSPSSLAWVVNAYLISFGGLLLLAGRLGDLLGARRVFLGGLTVFSIASMACGLAPNQLTLVVARFVQGAGGALTSAVILGMIVTMFPEPGDQAKAIGVFAFVASAGGAVGLLAGGVLTQAINWHWIFFINVPIGIATAALTRRYVSADRGGRRAAGMDVSGALLVTLALMLGVYTIVKPAAEHGWTAGRTLGCAALSVVLLVGFVIREARAANPLMPLRIFRSRNVCGANVIQVVGAAGMFGTFFLGALYVQKVLHYDPLKIGFAFLPVSVLMGVLSVRYSARLILRFGARSLCVLGLALIAGALAMLAMVPVAGGYWLHLFPPLALIGLGAGLCFPPLMGLAMSGATPQDAGLASGLINTTGQVGGALGLAVLATLTSTRTAHLTAAGHSTAVALTGGYHLGFWISAALVVLGIVVALLVLQPAAEQPDRPDIARPEFPRHAEPAGNSGRTMQH
ncbi:MAG: DHA2 family efflux MFS transporter permease subunit [Actinomycetota bacterium]|nr:DHA2 family efflux MFS transporter permease subunit [Actinomycetota bacterium]MDQ2955718.1 DHA2 family efflux MFS transporter permease subunit [Actinomycetota bacterium]